MEIYFLTLAEIQEIHRAQVGMFGGGRSWHKRCDTLLTKVKSFLVHRP